MRQAAPGERGVRKKEIELGGKRLILACERGQAKVSAELVTRYERQADAEDYPYSIHLLKCPGCGDALLVSVDDISQ